MPAFCGRPRNNVYLVFVCFVYKCRVCVSDIHASAKAGISHRVCRLRCYFLIDWKQKNFCFLFECWIISGGRGGELLIDFNQGESCYFLMQKECLGSFGAPLRDILYTIFMWWLNCGRNSRRLTVKKATRDMTNKGPAVTMLAGICLSSSIG